MTQLEIEAFLSIIKYGSITAAAEKLFVTQPALSRRINAIEEELGYKLILRQKGVRSVCLTAEGKSFIAVAEKLEHVYREAMSISNLHNNPILNLASIGSVSTYLLPDVFERFTSSNEGYNLSFHNYHSYESYGYVESGMTDIAIISDDIYSKEVLTVPAFREPFVLISSNGFASGKTISTDELDPHNEIRLPWNPEFDAWHEKRFDATVYPKVTLDQMSLMEEFITGDNWAITPLSVAKKVNKKSIKTAVLKDAPPDRVIYYLINPQRKEKMISYFLDLLKDEISKIDGMQSFL